MRLIALLLSLFVVEVMMSTPLHAESIPLPSPQRQGELSLEEAIGQRHSVRHFSPDPITLQQVGQLAWAAQGLTHGEGLRSAPSAGALYPIELYLVVGNVAELAPGVYHYNPARHGITRVIEGDHRTGLAQAALQQMWMSEAPLLVVITGVEGRTGRKYGGRAERYVAIEVGHVGQNLLLQATALGLGSVVVGAFGDRAVGELLGLDRATQPLSIIPIGHMAK